MTQVSAIGVSKLDFEPYNFHFFAQLDITQVGLRPDQFVPGLLSAIIILVVGFILAYVIAAIVGGILQRTGLERWLASVMSDESSSTSPLQVEKWISGFVFWIVIVFTLVAALQSLQLTTVSIPLQEFLSRLTSALPSFAYALLLAGIAWVSATIVKLIVTRSLRSFGLDRRLQQISAEPGAGQPAISSSIGNILFAIILLLFLPTILTVLGLAVAAQPVLTLLSQGLLVLLNVIGAVAIGFVGWFVARFVGRLVTSLLSTTGLDRLGTNIGFNPGTGGQTLSQIGGTVTYVAILIPTAIAALQVLQIQAISVPAIAMLNQILSALPKIFTAFAILAISFVAGRFIGRLVTSILRGLGFNNILAWVGVAQVPSAAASPNSVRSPSEIAGIVTVGGIVLFGVVTATEVLQLPALTAIVQSLIKIFGQILSSLLVFAVGLYLANLAFNLITNSGSSQSRILGHTARVAIIAFVSAMALRQMGVATDIVNLAFGLLLGAIAVAIALAFGLGGREIAAEQVRDWLANFKQGQLPNAPAASAAQAVPPITNQTQSWPPDENEWTSNE